MRKRIESKRDEVLAKMAALGFDQDDQASLADHFLDAEARGRQGHGLTRVDWLAGLPDLDPHARPERVHAEPGFERWDGRGALGYLTLAAICRAQLADPPEQGARRSSPRTASHRDARATGCGSSPTAGSSPR